MKAVANIYSDSEINDTTAQEILGFRSFPGATVSSGSACDVFDVPSTSMTQYPEALVVSVFSGPDEEESMGPVPTRSVFLLPGLKGLEFSELYTVRELPEVVRDQLSNFHQQDSEQELYKIADVIVEWVTDASATEQAALSAEFHELQPRNLHVLLSALTDSEVQLKSETLRHTIAGVLSSHDKRLAQTAALCLLQCGGRLGKALLQFRLANAVSVPHCDLILGAIKLVTLE